jgi:hypothetical protein
LDGHFQWLLSWLTSPLAPPPPVIPTPPVIVNPPAPTSKVWGEIWAQPIATGAAAFAAFVAAFIAFYVASRGRKQIENQFRDSHELDVLRSLRERYTAIGTQLADSSIAVRSAGAYALAALADDWLARGDRRPARDNRRCLRWRNRHLARDDGRLGHDIRGEVQACIDVLCSYLRMPYAPVKTTAQGRVKTIRTMNTGSEVIEEHYEYRQDDGDVRQNILGLITKHLQASADPSWSDFSFKLGGVFFDAATFAECVFNKPVTFTGATFSGESCYFSNAVFNDSVWLDEVTFSSKTVWFDHAKFLGKYTSFERAKFVPELRFVPEERYVDFSAAEFESTIVWFEDITWDVPDGVDFRGVSISDGVQFGAGAKPPGIVPDVWPPATKPPPATK